jgi:hypothetical protein
MNNLALFDKKHGKKVERILDLLDMIKDEINCIPSDWADLDTAEQEQVPKDLVRIEKHLVSTAKLFSHYRPDFS